VIEVGKNPVAATFNGRDGQGRVEHATVALRRTS